MNKKGQTSTDTPIVLSILVFQAFIIIMLGFLNITPDGNVSSGEVSLNISGVTTTEQSTSLFSIGNIINSINALGWGNTILFSPLVVCISYIIAKLIRGGG